MFGLGTIINTGCIVVGGIFGLLFGKLLTERFQKILNAAMALCIIAMALAGTVAKMLVITETGVETQGTYVLLFSLVLGGIAGEAIDIDRKLERFGVWLREITKSTRDTGFVDGFVTASLTVCIGAMAVVGSVMDGVNGDYSILLTKGIMDFVLVLVMAASKGKGCVFSAVPVFLLQGSITVAARIISPLLNEAAMNDLSLVGSVLILCIGVNLLADGKFRIKVANLLPGIVFAVVAAYLPFLN